MSIFLLLFLLPTTITGVIRQKTNEIFFIWELQARQWCRVTEIDGLFESCLSRIHQRKKREQCSYYAVNFNMESKILNELARTW